MKNNIKKLRLSRKITQQQMADYCNVALRTYQRIENEERKGDIEVWQCIAKFFNTTIDALLEQADDETKPSKT